MTTNPSLIAAEISLLFQPVHPESRANLESVIASKIQPLVDRQKATQFQINKIANSVCFDSSGESRSAKQKLANELFPESRDDIQIAICSHPVEQDWDEFRACPWEERKKYLLPEKESDKVKNMKNSNVLGLQGGGVLGLGQVDILMALEQKSGLCSDIFGLIAGTSVGSIIGACLSVGIPASQIRSFFTVEAPKIFKHNWIDDLESLVHPKYNSTQIENSLQKVLGDYTLADCKTKFIATAYDFATDRPVYFKSYEKSSQDKNFIVVGYDSGIALWQVCRASSAAQTYFPAFKWNSMVLIDGGNASDNAPDLLATVEALQFIPLTLIKMLSLGSGDSDWVVDVESMVEPSAIRAGLETIKILFSAGEDAQIYKTKRLLGNQHYRISPNLGNGQPIDDASDRALGKLAAAAAEAIQKNQAALDEFSIPSQVAEHQ